MLSERDVLPYLLDSGLVSAAAVLDGGIRVLDASQRNRTYKVIAGTGPSFLLKQGADREASVTVAHEADVYRFLLDGAGGHGLARFLPRFHGYDADEEVLRLELMPDALNLQEYAKTRGRFSTSHAGAIGRALAALHTIPEPSQLALSRAPPWVLSVHRPTLSVLRDFSGANIQFIKLVQEYGAFGEHLDALRRTWTPTVITHADFKWGNCVVSRSASSRRHARLSIVDWELARLGDPSWDVGSVFHDYLSFWLLSIPITGEAPPDRFLELAPYPLEKMQPAMRAFWRAYVACRGLAAADANRLCCAPPGWRRRG